MGMEYTEIDSILVPGFKMSLPSSGTVEFQFPPKITNDSMSGDFKNVTTPIPGHYPMFVYAGPNERFFTVETCYIVDGASWNAGKIKGVLRKLRSYYFDLRLTLSANKGAIKCKFWDMAGDSETTFFMRNLNIKHGQTMISSSTSKDSSMGRSSRDAMSATGVFPLRTDVTFDLVLWWNFVPIKNALEPKNGINPQGGGGGVGGGGGAVGRSVPPGLGFTAGGVNVSVTVGGEGGGVGAPAGAPAGDKDKSVYGSDGASNTELQKSGSEGSDWY